LGVGSGAVGRMELVDIGFWPGRRVFLTGHTGFKGSWLSLWLAQLGARVSGYSLPPNAEGNLFDQADVKDVLLKSTFGDIREYATVQDALQEAQPEIVFHLAAQALVRQSYADPVGTYATNVMGTVNLLEAVRQVGSVRAVVVVTSDKCYENRGWVWGYRESDAMGGHDPYSSSKACTELIASAYRSSYFSAGVDDKSFPASIATVRAGNVIGGGDYSRDRLLPDLFRAIQAGRGVCLRYPRAVRPWQHVLEPLAAYLRLAQALVEQGGSFAHAFNIGPNDSDCWPVADVVTRVCELWGVDATWTQEAGQQPHEASALKLDISKAQNLLSWRPVTNVEEAIEWTVSWQKRCMEGLSARELTLSQIKAFQARAALSLARQHTSHAQPA